MFPQALAWKLESVRRSANDLARGWARLGSVAVVGVCHERLRTVARNEFGGFWGRSHLRYPWTSRNRKDRVREMEDTATGG